MTHQHKSIRRTVTLLRRAIAASSGAYTDNPKLHEARRHMHQAVQKLDEVEGRIETVKARQKKIDESMTPTPQNPKAVADTLTTLDSWIAQTKGEIAELEAKTRGDGEVIRD